jgi:cytochrome bd-type quinol oxidase subunit 1
MYYSLTISLVVVVAYIASLVLLRKRRITLAKQRLFWNIVLLVTFILSGGSGLLLAIMLDHQVVWSGYISFLRLHVEFGIVMAIIAIFHLLWHARYYLTLFKKED